MKEERMTIEEFIEARLTEDEQRAQSEASPARIPDGDSVLEVTDLAVQRPALEVLRRCTMIRAMMRHAEDAGGMDRQIHAEWSGAPRDPVGDPVIDVLMHRDIAAVWSTHPDYRAEWNTP